ncbi:MAG: cupin domain-containing protein, partial [Woeseiaceae bacterium]
AHEGVVVPQGNISYQDATGRFYSGVRTHAAHVSESKAHPYNEFACIKDGSITLTDEQGSSQEFVAGDAYFIPQGVVCSVAVEESVSMYIALIQPD